MSRTLKTRCVDTIINIFGGHPDILMKIQKADIWGGVLLSTCTIWKPLYVAPRCVSHQIQHEASTGNHATKSHQIWPDLGAGSVQDACSSHRCYYPEYTMRTFILSGLPSSHWGYLSQEIQRPWTDRPPSSLDGKNIACSSKSHTTSSSNPISNKTAILRQADRRACTGL